MPFPQFDRNKLLIKPLSERLNKVIIENDHVPIDSEPKNKSAEFLELIELTTERIKFAHENKASVMLTMGAHTIKNGMAPTLIKLLEEKWITHLATNGAGIIHDWEFAFQGLSSEDVKANVMLGQFGIWEETGKYLNLAIIVGAFEGKGYGESVGSMIENEGVNIPSNDEIAEIVNNYNNDIERSAAAIDLLKIKSDFNLQSGWMKINFPYKKYCVQAAAYKYGIPFTSHPMFGHDIIYTHPFNYGAAIGRAAQRDFLTYANSVNNIENGVYMSVGSAVMSPMIFEKSLSMSQNLHIQNKEHIDNHFMLIVDLAEATWDWSKGEPPITNPAYYLRYLKTFNRMGGTMKYLSADNRDFLLALYQTLIK